MGKLVALVIAAAVAFGAPRMAAAQDGDDTQLDYFAEQRKTPLTYRLEGERTRNERLVILSLAGATLLAGGIGVYYNLESDEAADDVTELSGMHSMRTYTPEVDARRQDALDAKTMATVFYVTGGAFLIGTVVAYIVTSPEDEIHQYESGADSRVSTAPYVVPIERGVAVGKAWKF